MPHAGSAERIEPGSMKEPKLVLRAAHCDVESLASRFVSQRTDPMISGRSHHAQEDHVALVTLEGVGVSADQPPLLDHRRVERSEEHVLCLLYTSPSPR